MMPRNLSAVFYEIATGRTAGAARRINSDSSFFRFYTPWIQTHRHQPNNSQGFRCPQNPTGDYYSGGPPLPNPRMQPLPRTQKTVCESRVGWATIRLTDRRSGGSRDSGYDTVYSLYDGGGKCVLFNQNRNMLLHLYHCESVLTNGSSYSPKSNRRFRQQGLRSRPDVFFPHKT